MRKLTFNNRIHGLQASASMDLMDKARILKKQGAHIISLAGGEPDFDTPKPVVNVGLQAICDGHTHYSDGRGIPALRQRIARKLSEENGIHCTPEEVLVTPGGKFAIFIAACALLNPGDEVLIFQPAWVSYAPIVKLCGGVPVSVPLSFNDNYAITEEILARAVTNNTRLIILNTPNNPTGRVLTQPEADLLADFVLAHNLSVIADEIYEKIIFDGHRHLSLASNPQLSDHIITVNGLSKCAAMTGWRIGYLQAAKEIVDNIYLAYQHSMTCTSEFTQLAAIEALNHPEEMQAMCESYQARRDFWCSRMLEIPGVTCPTPEGAFYAWMRIEKDGMNSAQMSDYLLEKAGVVMVPGEAYGEFESCCLRASFAISLQELEQAADQLQRVLGG